FHSRLLPSPPSGSHFSTRSFSIETRFCCGPRQLGQSIGSLSAAQAAVASGNSEVIRNRVAVPTCVILRTCFEIVRAALNPSPCGGGQGEGALVFGNSPSPQPSPGSAA